MTTIITPTSPESLEALSKHRVLWHKIEDCYGFIHDDGYFISKRIKGGLPIDGIHKDWTMEDLKREYPLIDFSDYELIDIQIIKI